jgi:hypothetical protein
VPHQAIFSTEMVLEFYRLIKMSRTDNHEMGTIEWSMEDTIHDAYRKCVLEDESQCCRRVLHSVRSELASGKDVVRVTSTKTHTYWIQSVTTRAAALPALNINECGCVIAGSV